MKDIIAVSENPDGTAAITVFAPNWVRKVARTYLKEIKKHKDGYLDSIDEDELYGLLSRKEKDDLIAEIIEHDRQKNGFGQMTRVERKDLPSDRYFRNAWKPDLTVDMDKAREIHMKQIRRARDKRLTELDQRQYGPEYDAERQNLRDIPQTFDLTANTPDELKALWPDGLERK